MKKIVVLIGGSLLVLLGAYYLVHTYRATKRDDRTVQNKLRIAASFYPLANLAQQAGGSFVEVADITPSGAEPHDYEPAPKDIVTLESAKIVLLEGDGLDAWGDRLEPALKKSGITVLRMSDHIPSLKSKGGSGNLANDPHFWLDPDLYGNMLILVRNAMKQADPVHAAIYDANTNAYLEKLSRLGNAYKNGLASCGQREIIVSHNAFNYLADKYHFTTLYISGISPDEEPSAKTIARIVDTAKSKNMHYVFFETLVSPRIADTIAREIGGQTLVLNPLEGLTSQDMEAGKSYIGIMEENLINLRKAMACR